MFAAPRLIFPLWVLLVIAAAASSCGRPHKTLVLPVLQPKGVEPGEGPTVVGDERTQFSVVGPEALKAAIGKETVLPASRSDGRQALKGLAAAVALNGQVEEVRVGTPGSSLRPTEVLAGAPRSPSLIIGFPSKLLGEAHIFGGILTKVMNRDRPELGDLKLVELEALHVRPYLTKNSSNEYFWTLFGCTYQCYEEAPQEQLLSLPISGVTSDLSLIYLDLSVLGQELRLIDLLDPEGEYTQLKSRSSRTSFVDFSSATLVFDVESDMIPFQADPSDPEIGATLVTARWYLKIESGLNSAFIPRPPTGGVGFFGTARSRDEWILRHSLTRYGEDVAPVTYVAKNFPEWVRPRLEEVFAAWNLVFRDAAGQDLLELYFVDGAGEDAPVAGDVRFNVFEWDLDNVASYGGLGPAVASQTSGEIFSANVLVQGPTIVKIYREWFNLIEEARALRQSGLEAEAEQRLSEFVHKMKDESARLRQTPPPRVMLGNLELRVPARQAALHDPKAGVLSFFEIPEGETYESYMRGYWHDLFAHELGHNLGLRHNFRGNLGADDFNRLPSSSIMEYLAAPYRYRSKLGVYDSMAVAYGYSGKSPHLSNAYCTDEDVPSLGEPQLSAECSRDDATNDPFAMLLGLLKRVVDKGIARDTATAPVWTAEELNGRLETAVGGLAFYATSAEQHAASWSAWPGDPERPLAPPQIREYVASKIRGKLCDPSIEAVLRGKDAAERPATESNLKAIRGLAFSLLEGLGIENGVPCQ